MQIFISTIKTFANKQGVNGRLYFRCLQFEISLCIEDMIKMDDVFSLTYEPVFPL